MIMLSDAVSPNPKLEPNLEPYEEAVQVDGSTKAYAWSLRPPLKQEITK